MQPNPEPGTFDLTRFGVRFGPPGRPMRPICGWQWLSLPVFLPLALIVTLGLGKGYRVLPPARDGQVDVVGANDFERFGFLVMLLVAGGLFLIPLFCIVLKWAAQFYPWIEPLRDSLLLFVVGYVSVISGFRFRLTLQPDLKTVTLENRSYWFRKTRHVFQGVVRLDFHNPENADEPECLVLRVFGGVPEARFGPRCPALFSLKRELDRVFPWHQT